MRIPLCIAATMLASGASASLVAPAPQTEVARTPDADAKQGCRDRIHEVRAERALPDLRRDSEMPDAPLMIAAVDKRIDGCAVMVMHDNTSDIRPLPAPREGPLSLRPAQ